MHTIPNKRQTKTNQDKNRIQIGRADTMVNPFTHKSPLVITGKWDEVIRRLDHGTLSANFENCTDEPAKNAGTSCGAHPQKLHT